MEQRYVFFTEEGYTTSPNGDALDSFQILGFESAKTPDEAISVLVNNNPWISKSGFDIGKIQYCAVVSNNYIKPVGTIK